MKSIKNILIVNHHHIGDVVCSTSLVIGVRRKYPDARIRMFVRDNSIQHLFEPGIIDEYVLYPKSKWNTAKTIAALSKPRPDLIVCTTELSHTWFVSALCMYSRAKHVVCEDNAHWFFNRKTLVPFQYELHKFESNGKIAEALDVTLPFPKPHVYVSAQTAGVARDRLAAIPNSSPIKIAISPGCHSLPHKAWPAEKFAALIDRILESGKATPILMGSPPEIPLAEKIIAALKPQHAAGCISLVGKVSLSEAAAVLRETQLLVSNDNGMAHMASGLNLPVIVLFGPTPPGRCAPYQPDRVLWMKPACAPCYPKSKTGCGNPVCITDLPVERVFDSVRELAWREASFV